MNDSDEPVMTDDDYMDILKGHAIRIHEHFDSVQIVATKTDEDGSQIIVSGRGDYYARIGAMKSFIIREDAAAKRRGELDEEESE